MTFAKRRNLTTHFLESIPSLRKAYLYRPITCT